MGVQVSSPLNTSRSATSGCVSASCGRAPARGCRIFQQRASFVTEGSGSQVCSSAENFSFGGGLLRDRDKGHPAVLDLRPNLFECGEVGVATRARLSGRNASTSESLGSRALDDASFPSASGTGPAIRKSGREALCSFNRKKLLWKRWLGANFRLHDADTSRRIGRIDAAVAGVPADRSGRRTGRQVSWARRGP